MITLILFVLLLQPAQQVSVSCANKGEQAAAAETQAVRGPGGAAAVLKVSSTDDHSKNSHECMAEYQLLFTPAGTSTPVVVELTQSDAEYGRNLTLHLDGFSQDGQHVFGIFSEGGKYANSFLLDYNTTARQVQLIDLPKKFMGTIGCGLTVSVMGTDEKGLIALELNSVNGCAPQRRVLLDPVSHRLQDRSPTTTIRSFYKSESSAGVP